jgi:hypothetical protein
VPQSRGMEADDAALRAYYERGRERERLSDGRGDLEFTRTTEIVLRRLHSCLVITGSTLRSPVRPEQRWLDPASALRVSLAA